MKRDEERLLTVGELARRAGVPKRFVTYASEIELITPSARSPAGYRLYSEGQVQEVAFIRQMQALGFYADQIKEMRAIRSSDLPRADREVLFARIYDRHLQYLQQKAEHFSRLYERCLEARGTKMEEILSG